MPWRVRNVSNERLEFVRRLERGERMTELCREFGISRKTGYKFWNRYKERGAEALGDYSRRPHRMPTRTSSEIAEVIVEARRRFPAWGPVALRAWLLRENPALPVPSPSTIGKILKSAGLVPRRRRRKRRSKPTPPAELTQAIEPNDVWTADYKGQHRMRDGGMCFPLTIMDLASRFVISVEALSSTKAESAMAVFEQAFRQHGLPRVIRTDNGSPFASVGLAGLSRLSAWWVRLGIKPERIEPGQPQQNGAHERMHRTLKASMGEPGRNLLQQQERYDEFRASYNHHRPHRALGLKVPADIYRGSERAHPLFLQDPTYPLCDKVMTVQAGGRVHLPTGAIYVGRNLALQPVGLKKLPDGRWLVHFMDTIVGVIDTQTRTMFESRVAPDALDAVTRTHLRQATENSAPTEQEDE